MLALRSGFLRRGRAVHDPQPEMPVKQGRFHGLARMCLPCLRDRGALFVRQKRVATLENELRIEEPQRGCTTRQTMLLCFKRSPKRHRQRGFMALQPVLSLLHGETQSGVQAVLQTRELLLTEVQAR